MIPTLIQTELFTAPDGFARFRELPLPLTEGTPQSRLSAALPAGSYRFRQSPVGFTSDWHCTGHPQWTFILAGQMEIFLRDGSSRVFSAGEGFFSNDLLPTGKTFDAAVHGHRSRQVGDAPLVTLFLLAP